MIGCACQFLWGMTEVLGKIRRLISEGSLNAKN